MEWLLNDGSSQEELQTLCNKQYESLQSSMNNNNIMVMVILIMKIFANGDIETYLT